ncbi:BrnA antitoxin family protein [Polynucleobacter paneuropaeus]|nr:BrnA antitoxin family protein [Polynucleobacter paneuropaeus]
MKKTLALTNKDGEVRELTGEDLRSFKSAKDVLPTSLLKKLGVRGVQKAPKKIVTTIRLSPDVLEKFKATGDGWQTRIDTSLRQFISEHPIPR